MARWRIGLVIVFCGLAAYLFAASYWLPSTIFQPLGGDGYVRIVAVFLFLASIAWLVAIIASIRPGRTEASAAHPAPSSPATSRKTGNDRGERIVRWYALFTVLYAGAVFTVGYFVSTFVFVLGSMMMFVDDWRPRFHRLILLTVGITLTLLLLFRAVRFYVPQAWLF